MTDDQNLLLWQRIALERGEPIDIPPHQRARRDATPSSAKQHQNLELPTVYQIELPWPRPPLNHNHRHTPWGKGKIVAAIRADVLVLVRAAKVPQCERLTVQLHYAPGHRRKQDPMNWTATSKPAIDAIVDAGVVVDDDTEHVHELTPEIHFPPVPGPRCWLTITPGGVPS